MEVLYFRPLAEEAPRSLRLPAPSGLAERVDSVDADAIGWSNTSEQPQTRESRLNRLFRAFRSRPATQSSVADAYHSRRRAA